jgi:hypothetical protein
MTQRVVFRVVTVVTTYCEYETDCISKEILRLLPNGRTKDFQPFPCDVIKKAKLHLTICKRARNFANPGGRAV